MGAVSNLEKKQRVTSNLASSSRNLHLGLHSVPPHAALWALVSVPLDILGAVFAVCHYGRDPVCGRGGDAVTL